jgi:hypothetical protein
VKLSNTRAALTIQTQIAAILVPGFGGRAVVAFCGVACGVVVGCPTGGERACPQLTQNFAVSAFSVLQCRQRMFGLCLKLAAVGPELETEAGTSDGEYENIFQRVRKNAQI